MSDIMVKFNIDPKQERKQSHRIVRGMALPILEEAVEKMMPSLSRVEAGRLAYSEYEKRRGNLDNLGTYLTTRDPAPQDCWKAEWIIGQVPGDLPWKFYIEAQRKRGIFKVTYKAETDLIGTFQVSQLGSKQGDE